MKWTQIFPSILILLDLLSAAGYAYHHDWRHVIYWIAAAILTASVTF
jgi:hypothetical protein